MKKRVKGAKECPAKPPTNCNGQNCSTVPSLKSLAKTALSLVSQKEETLSCESSEQHPASKVKKRDLVCYSTINEAGSSVTSEPKEEKLADSNSKEEETCPNVVEVKGESYHEKARAVGKPYPKTAKGVVESHPKIVETAEQFWSKIAESAAQFHLNIIEDVGEFLPNKPEGTIGSHPDGAKSIEDSFSNNAENVKKKWLSSVTYTSKPYGRIYFFH